MHVHILGIAGTFMGGIAAIARAAGHRVTGSDRNVYPPMSTQLAALDIEVVEGFDAAQLSPAPDVVVVGNVMSRGQAVIEALLDSNIAYASGPEWLAREVLQGRWVLGVSGTHGKTTTSSMLAQILDHAGLAPGFLIGGVPGNFATSARLGETPFFVIEADEYDTAFFDKRAKFVHYHPRTLILNNLEFDHADIYPDLPAIERQFNHLLRTVPGNGLVVLNSADQNLGNVLAMGCWTAQEGFGRGVGPGMPPPLWTARIEQGGDYSEFDVLEDGRSRGRLRWQQIGAHNADNALAAIAAARHAGVPVQRSIEALAQFVGVRRRMELRGTEAGVSVYDDFAHHPTAIATTIDGLRRRVGKSRLIAVLEPRSNTMKLGTHKDTLGPSLMAADEVFLFAAPDLGWDTGPTLAPLGARGHAAATLDALLLQLEGMLRAGDHVLIMSNGGFGGLHTRLLAALKQRAA
ncbi:MAG: UDP-N-acetylmuramate:L-alanyl-gamma-D-glutamyl-meso-diaminopimelate ligase [Steroidobacteraceae bacterium]